MKTVILWLVFIPALIISLIGILAEYVVNFARRVEDLVTEKLT